DVLDPAIAELAVAQAGDGVVLVEALLRLGGRLDVPFDQRRAERLGDFVREDGLAGARLALDQQRALQGDRGIDRHAQVVTCDVGIGSRKFHGAKSAFTGCWLTLVIYPRKRTTDLTAQAHDEINDGRAND